MFLDTFKRNIINQIVAVDDGATLHNPVEHYFRAFTGAFKADMPFTFYFEAKNKLLMFVYDPTPIAVRSSHALFIEQCERIRANILPITGFIRELADTGYLELTPLDARERPPLPQNYENYWRKYKNFYMDVIEGLSFVCYSRLRPQQKLYDVWLKFNPNALVS